MPEGLAALVPDARVAVDTSPWLVFRPVDRAPTVGLILYPGGRVDPRAYAPAARTVAEQGYLVAIVPVPLNLAFFAPNRAAAVMAAFPSIERWAVGGHSLGGAMAASFAHGNPEAVHGLVLWASYPARSADLARRRLAVSSIYGTRDGLATRDQIEASRPLLPPDTRWVAVQGGNHAQFGWYGPQSGDNAAAISREVQQAQVVSATLELLAAVEGPQPAE
jgi:pimeloyl-ACP methyl ester carboxylesterase